MTWTESSLFAWANSPGGCILSNKGRAYSGNGENGATL